MGFRLSRPGRSVRPSLHELVLRANPLFERASAGAAMLEPLGIVPAVSRPHAWWTAAPWQAAADPVAEEAPEMLEPATTSEREGVPVREATAEPRMERRAIAARSHDTAKAPATPSLPPAATPAPPLANRPTPAAPPSAPADAKQELPPSPAAPVAPSVRSNGETVLEPTSRSVGPAEPVPPPVRPATPPGQSAARGAESTPPAAAASERAACRNWAACRCAVSHAAHGSSTA